MKRGIVEARLSGDYSLRQMGDYFGLHYLTADGIIKTINQRLDPYFLAIFLDIKKREHVGDKNMKWFMTYIFAPIVVMLVGGYLYLEMSELRKELKASFSSKIEENRQCHRMGETQICWGKLDVLQAPAGNEHTRTFAFNFSLPFAEIPVVTNGINSSSDGYAYAVYNYQATKESYNGNIVDVKFRKNTSPVGMNYMAM